MAHRCSRTWHCIRVYLVVDVTRGHNGPIFNPWRQDIMLYWNIRNQILWQCQTPEELIPHPHHCKNIKTCTAFLHLWFSFQGLCIRFFHFIKNFKCHIYYNDICFVFYTYIYFLLGVKRQSHWPIPGCSSNTIRGRSEGHWRIGEATAILIMLFANIAYRIMHTKLSSTQSESARFYSVFGLGNI